MKIGTPRVLYAAATLVTLPLVLWTLLVVFSLINPMGLMVLTGCNVENHSGKRLWVTPIGAVGHEGKRRPLPLSVGNLMTPFRKDLPLAQGVENSFTYDWDDIHFSEILVRNDRGEYRVMPTGLHPTEGQYRRPDQTNFVVASFDALPPASAIHLEALHYSGAEMMIFYALGLGGLLFLWFVYRAIFLPPTKPPPLPPETARNSNEDS